VQKLETGVVVHPIAEDWDRYFRSTSSVDGFIVEKRTVRLTVTEVNDWYRLVDRPPSRYYMSYDFDDRGRITGVLVIRPRSSKS